MPSTRVVVYGLSTEGYGIASRIAMQGTDVHIVDESTPSAISLNAEVAKTYPTVSSLMEDEPLLALEPIDTAISKAQYLFFTPKVRIAGNDYKVEINSKFKRAVSPLKEGSSVIYVLPAGFGDNAENMSLLEHVTGLIVGEKISYYYYPVSAAIPEPAVIGAFNANVDTDLTEMLALKRGKEFTTLPPSEYLHAIDVLRIFSGTSSMLEICKLATERTTIQYMSGTDLKDIYIDDMIKCLSDMVVLGLSPETPHALSYMIGNGLKRIDTYIKRLIDQVRTILKKRRLKTTKTKVVLSWSFDQNEMRSEKVETLKTLVSRLRDYVNDVEPSVGPDLAKYHTDSAVIAIACSKADYDRLSKNKFPSLIIVKANPLCDVI